MTSTTCHRWVRASCFALGVSLLGSAGCATTREVIELVVDHHVGMARSAGELVTGEAEARKGRVEQLHAELAENRVELDSEHDPTRRIPILQRRVALQESLLAEVQGAGPHHHVGSAAPPPVSTPAACPDAH